MPSVQTIAFACAALLASAAAAQTPAVPAGPLALEQVLDLAERRSESIEMATAGARRADGEILRARSGQLPQLNASLGYDRALASEFAGVFDDIDVGGPQEAGGFDDLPFGRANTWRAALSLSQNLFSGGRLEALRALAEAGRDTAAIGLATTRAQLLYEVTQAYYDAALSGRMVAIAEGTIGQMNETLRLTEAGFKTGTQPEFEVLRARVSRDAQMPHLVRQRANREIALLRLKQFLDLPADYDLQLSDTLDDELLPPAPIFAPRVAAVEAALGGGDRLRAMLQTPEQVVERSAVREVATAVRLREAALDAARAERMPSAALTSTYARIAYPSGLLPAFDRSNWNVGVNVQMPILTGGRQRADERVAEAELERTRAQLRQVQELTALDTRVAWAELIAAQAAWEATAGTVAQASRAHEIAEVRYEAGVSTQLELSDARLLLQQAEANRALAARDLQVARARVALLEDLPLGLGASPGSPMQAAPQPLPSPAPSLSGGQFSTAAAGGTQSFGNVQ